MYVLIVLQVRSTSVHICPAYIFHIPHLHDLLLSQQPLGAQSLGEGAIGCRLGGLITTAKELACSDTPESAVYFSEAGGVIVRTTHAHL